MITVLAPFNPELSVDYLDNRAWQIYADYFVSNPSAEPEFYTEWEFYAALCYHEVIVNDADGNVVLQFRF